VERYFSTLGARIHRSWQGLNYDEDRFAEVAEAALLRDPPAQHLHYQDLVHWLATTEDVPFQARLDAGFGEPPLTLFWNGRFQIDVLFWLSETTAVHQHGFAGAFTVLAGSSVHCRYAFSLSHKISSRFKTGTTRLQEVEWLRPGMVRPIARGADLIHSLFHLDVPSVTVVVRTCGDSEAGPEYTYYVPSIALDPSDQDALRIRQIQILEMLVRMESEDLDTIAREILERSDLHTAFLVLLKLGVSAQTFPLYERLLSMVRERHGEPVEAFLPAIAEQRRRQQVFELRRSITDPDLRFFLALVLNLPDRQAVDALVASRHPNTNVGERIEGWTRELAEAGRLGLEADPILLHLLQGCLRGWSDQRILDQLCTNYPREQVEGQREEVREACRRIRRHPILRPLFATPPSTPDPGSQSEDS
jgi:hypothetical protein